MNVIIIGSNRKENTELEILLNSIQTVTVLKIVESVSDAVVYLSKFKDLALFMSADFLGDESSELMDQFTTPAPVVVFSGSSSHAIKAFDEGVADYVLLPSTQARVSQALKKSGLRILKKEAPVLNAGLKDMYVRSNSKSLRILFSDVLFIEAMADYIVIHTQGFKFIVHYTMKGIQDQLPTDIFVRVHRSYIVNLDKIHAIDNQEVIINEKRIPIGGSNKEYFFSRLNII